MFGLKKKLKIFSVTKITLKYELCKGLENVSLKYSFEPNVGGFKAELKSYIEKECGLAYDKNEKYHYFKLKKELAERCATIHKQIANKYACKVESVRVPDTIVNDIIFKDTKRKILEKENMDRFGIEMQNYLPNDIIKKLYSYQREGIQYCMSKNFRCLIADGMGLGKTLQSICALKVCKEKNFSGRRMRILVICPSSLRVQWAEELKFWLSSDFSKENILCVFKNTDMQRLDLDKHDCLIMSYSLAAKNKELFLQLKFDFAIVDESHMLKNAKSKRTENIVPVLKRITHKLLLSGTPAFAKPSELYTQISIINSLLFPSFHNFGLRYCDAKQLNISVSGKFGKKYKPWDYSGCSNIAELNLLLKEKIMIRRVKEDVLKQLPSKLRTKIFLNASINKSLQKEMNEIKALLLKDKDTDLSEETFANTNDDNQVESEEVNLYPEEDESVMQMYSKLAKIKIKSVIEYFEEFFEDEENLDRKILVFCHHKEMMDALDEFFTKKVPLKKIRIDGQCSSEKRGNLVQQFQKDNDTKIALLSITAAGVGLTLTKSSLVIFTELHWTPAAILQAEDRSHRIGQENVVNIYYLVLKNSFEEIMWRMLNKKFRNVSKIIDNDHDTTGIKIKYNNDGVLPSDNSNPISFDEKINDKKINIISNNSNNTNKTKRKIDETNAVDDEEQIKKRKCV